MRIARGFFSTFLALAIGVVLSTTAFAGVYNPVTDFSIVSNPNSPWTFGTETTLGGAMTLLPLEETNCTTSGYENWWSTPTCITGPFVAKNNTGGVFTLFGTGGELIQMPTELNVVPGHTVFTVVRFTVPAAAPYRIDGIFRGIDMKPTTSDVHLFINGVDIWDALIAEYNVDHSFLVNQQLSAGSTIDFIVGSGGDATNDSNGLTVDIISTPEPSVLVLVALGCMALLAFRKLKNTRIV